MKKQQQMFADSVRIRKGTKVNESGAPALPYVLYYGAPTNAASFLIVASDAVFFRFY